MVNRPMFIQTVANETEMSAQFGSMNQAATISKTVARSPTAQPPSRSQFTREKPTPSTASFRTPMLGCSSTSQNTALIATEAAIVDENMVRKMTMPGSFWLASTASAVPMTIAGATV